MSEIRATTISDTSGTGPVTLTKQSAAKAWVNFNGTGTIAIRDSLNVSSLTDNTVGNYGINLSSSFNAVDYSFNMNSTNVNNGYVRDFSSSVNSVSTYYQIHAEYATYTQVDSPNLTSQAFGDLA